MLDRDLEHPDIRTIATYGRLPYAGTVVICDECECGIHAGETVYAGPTRVTGNFTRYEQNLCGDCFREYILEQLEALTTVELADWLKIEHKVVG